MQLADLGKMFREVRRSTKCLSSLFTLQEMALGVCVRVRMCACARAHACMHAFTDISYFGTVNSLPNTFRKRLSFLRFSLLLRAHLHFHDAPHVSPCQCFHKGGFLSSAQTVGCLGWGQGVWKIALCCKCACPTSVVITGRSFCASHPCQSHGWWGEDRHPFPVPCVSDLL